MPEDAAVLQFYNGQKVLVNPEPKKASWSDESVALQVNGVAVYVNPESVLRVNEVASIPMIPHMELGPGKNELIVGPDEIVVL